MTPYLVIFAIILLLGIVIDSKRVSNSIKKTALLVIIISSSIFGGLRAYDIGYDIGVYGYNYFKTAERSSSLTKYLNDRANMSDEAAKDYGYMVLNYFAAKTTHNFTAFLVILQLLTNAPVFIALYKNRKKGSFVLGALAYLCLFYCRNFNMLRQGAALSLTLLAHAYLEKDKMPKFVALSALAYSMHSTAIYATLLQIATRLIRNAKKEKAYKYVIAFTGVVVALIIPTLSLLQKIGLVSTRIAQYSEVRQNSEGAPTTDLIIFTLLALTSVISMIKNKKKDSAKKEIDFLSVEGYILYFTRMAITYSDRFALYLQYNSLLAMPQTVSNISKKHKTMITTIISISLISYWFYKHVVLGAHAVIPYKSVL